jgi:hypothetical protein
MSLTWAADIAHEARNNFISYKMESWKPCNGKYFVTVVDL